MLTESALESLVNKVGPRMKLFKVIKLMGKNLSNVGVSNASGSSPCASESSETDVVMLGNQNSPHCDLPISSRYA